ncbi:MAG: hypothetical protein A2Z18_10550 [Armatimonadetes bacterium RBG_16_58_9]|nr:MAG: hypothetical protein A2Z18_10550 [Armatimonadetes bacterium RBG_16_58_9]
MDYKNIIVQSDGGIATITINRPETLNILDDATLLETESALRALDDGRPGAIVLTGAGEKAFVAGGDIAAMSKMNPVFQGK